MKTLKAPPGARRLIESLRDLGYECHTAIADLVDNSIAASASDVYVDVLHSEDGRPAAIIVADNGKGMDRDALQEAMRWGAFQDYAANDLGKYGLGLKTASLSQCRTLTVHSKPKPAVGARSRRTIMRWDLDHVFKADDWLLQVPEPEELRKWELELLEHKAAADHGTVVLWTGLAEAIPMLEAKDENAKQRFLAHLLSDIEIHLRSVFHRFMQNKVQGRRKLNIWVGEKKLKPWDPFCVDEDETQSLPPKSYEISAIVGGKVKVVKVEASPYILPNKRQFSSEQAWRDASGEKKWNFQQGFYFYRNGRLLRAGGWSYMRSVDEHLKLLRIAVDFPPGLDKAFAVNITKMRAKVPAEIYGQVSDDLKKWSGLARSCYDDKEPSGKGRGGSKKKEAEKSGPERGSQNSPALKRAGVSLILSPSGGKITASKDKDGVRIVVPFKHEAATLFDKKVGRSSDSKELAIILFTLIEAVFEGRIKPADIPLKKLRDQLGDIL